MTKIADLKARWMNDPEFRVAYAEADAEFAVIEASLRLAKAQPSASSPHGNDSQNQRQSPRKD
jgi:hypothetical protein